MTAHTPNYPRRLIAVLATTLVAMATLFAASSPARADDPAPQKGAANFEVHFMTTMADHHMMATMMSEMCLEKAVHEELQSMCQDIITAQSAEITMLQGWLNDWYSIDYEPQMSKGEERSMQRLEHLEGEHFEIAFMKSMTRHHWGAVAAAKKCLKRASHPELVAMCDDIIETQSDEIETMQGWLCEWYDRCGGRPVRD